MTLLTSSAIPCSCFAQHYSGHGNNVNHYTTLGSNSADHWHKQNHPLTLVFEGGSAGVDSPTNEVILHNGSAM